MAKKKITNASTSWVPSEFEQSDLTKAEENGFLAGGDQVIFPSTERIPKLPNGYQVIFFPFFCAAYPFLPMNFFAGFSLFTMCSFTSSRQILFCTSVSDLDTGVSRSTCSWAPSTTQLLPRGKSMTEAQRRRPS
jgi:hypothetical protein